MPLESVASKDIPAQKLGGKDGLREGALSVDNPSGCFLY